MGRRRTHHPSPVGTGTTTTPHGQFLGRSMKAVYTVVRYEPRRLTEWRTVAGPLPLTFRRAFAPVEGGTRLTFTYDAAPNVVLRLPAPLIVRMGRRRLDGDIPQLRAILET